MRKTLLAMLAVVALMGAGCANDGKPDAVTDVQDTVRASVNAENAKDVDAFLDLWTDDGLEAYDVGSRADLKAGQTDGFGNDPIEIVAFGETTVEGEKASAVVDAARREVKVAKALFRVRFDLVQADDEWKLDGFEFMGSPPAAAGAEKVRVTGTEYAFAMDEALPSDVALTFVNAGEEPHEIALFKAPEGTDVAKAKADLSDVDGSDPSTVPDGYTGDHLSFAEPGQTMDVSFAEPLDPGTYVFACYLPAGGFSPEGEPLDPDGAPHIELGMVAVATVS